MALVEFLGDILITAHCTLLVYKEWNIYLMEGITLFGLDGAAVVTNDGVFLLLRVALGDIYNERILLGLRGL